METEKYFEKISEQTDKAFEVANEARSQSKDPEKKADIPVATDLPEKASSLVMAAKFPELEDQGVPERIRELEDEYGKNDERVAFSIAREIAQGDFYEFDDKEKACNAGIRVGVSYMTGGITTAPLEGIGEIKIRENNDGTEYLAVYYSGPIRSAGGTASAMSVLLSDYVRIGVGLDKFKPSDTVVKRYAAEVEDYYNRITAKQYNPTREETEFIAENVPVEVTGSPTEQLDVSNYKDLDRVQSNRIRGGMCLVYLDGLPLKAPKIKKRIEKWGEEFGLEHWEWVGGYLDLQKEIHSSGDSDEEEEEDGKEEEKGYTPSDKYLGSLTAGRPVFGHPGRKGGFRLRYGHSRTNGLAATSFHPATMEVTERFLSIGTQMKTEYPMKATVGTPCESIHPPVVKLENGDVMRMESREMVTKYEDDIEEILFLGDMLTPFGEFVENGKKLLPSPYVEEWWEKELGRAVEQKDVKLGRDFTDRDPTPEEAFKISEKLGIPLHPKWTYHWTETTVERFKALYSSLENEDLSGKKTKECLEDILLQHKMEDGEIKLTKNDHKVLKALLRPEQDNEDALNDIESAEDIPEFIEEVSGVELREQAPHYLGGRMGRPEKAERRTIKGKPQLLFPCGKEEGGRMRNLAAAYEHGKINGEGIIHNKCPECGDYSYFSYCLDCNVSTEPIWFCTDCKKEHKEEKEVCDSCGNDRLSRYKYTDIEVEDLVNRAMDNLGIRKMPELLKSVRGMSGKHKHVEPIEKGFLREKYDLYVNKDGTVRYDASDLPMTHFKPKEISVSVERLRELGYTEDVDGEPLESEDQVLAMKPQDIVIPDSDNTLAAGDYFMRVADFVDELLEKFYGLEPYYNVEDKEDLVGSLVIGLAPHTSGGTVGRIIGFTDAKGIYAHPYWHAAKRRNCLPGDEKIKLANGDSIKLKELFERADGAEEADSTGTVEKSIDLDVVSEQNGSLNSSKASKVYRAPAQEFKIHFETGSGRKISVFPDHKVKTEEGIKKARAVDEGDKVINPLTIPVEEDDILKIRITDFIEPEDISIRGSNEELNRLIDSLGGLKSASDEIGTNKKTLSNYRYRESTPIEVLNNLSEAADKDYSISDDAVLAAKRDNIEIENTVKIDKHFMKLIGYYLAEGYIRKSEQKGEEFYQVCFAFGEEKLKKDIEQSIVEVFGVEPSEGDHILTISSRIIYEVFENLEAGKGAHTKKVPQLVKSLPKEKVRHMLSAYFAGDGAVEDGRLHINATSVSRELLDDMDFLLKRFGIFARFSTSEREAGGILIDKYGEEHYEGETFTSHKLHIRSSFAVKFGKEIGFELERKQQTLEKDYEKARKPRIEIKNDLVLDEITEKEIEKAEERFMYDIEVEETHNFLTSENLITNNCDGDEDAILLLMDGLLNFSREFLPDMTGARTMDAPLILSTVLNADEVDDEAWAIETVDEYPLSFYEETLDYKKPWELETEIQIGEDIVHSDEPFRHGYTHDTDNVENGPNQSEYVTLDEMSDKTSSQLGLCEKLKCVDEDSVAELLLNKHFIPDIKGNLRSFSSQEMRCVDCNTKFRRVPMTNQTIAPTGKTTAQCPECDGKVLLTISEGTIKKYLNPSKDLIDEYEISPYTRQEILVLKKTIQSLFGKDNRQSGLEQFTV